MSFLNNLFSKTVVAKDKLGFLIEELLPVASANRSTLSLIENWIDEAAFKNSCFNYGVPDFIRSDINKPVGEALTYTDIMVFLSKKHFERLNYLEIGVSVGKNFFQLVNSHDQGNFVGFDIEEINPVLAKQFVFKSEEAWTTKSDSIKKSHSSFRHFSFKREEVGYLCGDVWDENSWKRLAGRKFNIIFSDALHSPKALLFEFEMIVKYGLLDEKFVIIWDDLVGKMKNSFFKIIKKYDKVIPIRDVYLLDINGWVGEHEAPHSVGIISSFSL